jgi:cysteinyl-tRNA synthetase
VATEDNPSDAGRRVLNRAYKSLVEVCGVLGIYTGEEASSDIHTALTAELIELVLEVRQDARGRKDWETADKIRDRLEHLNIELQDSRTGTTWKIIKGEV